MSISKKKLKFFSNSFNDIIICKTKDIGILNLMNP